MNLLLTLYDVFRDIRKISGEGKGTVVFFIRGTLPLTIKSQNVGAWTKNVCKQMFNFDTLDSNK